MPRVTFNNKSNAFYTSIKARVENYFTSKNIKKTGNWTLYSKTLILVLSSVTIYILLLTAPLSPLPAILLSCLFGFILAGIGFNLMHDACHGSYSSKKWVNELVGYSLNALGGNAFIWKVKHNILHHTYTNVDGADGDIAKSPLLRLCPYQKWVPAHRLQYIYVVLVYAISSFAWVFILDFYRYFKHEVFNTPLQRMSTKEHIIFWLSKALYSVFYIAIPVVFVGWGPWAVGFAFMHITMGLALSLVFQLAHVVEHVEFEAAAGMEHKLIENEWAKHQVITTSNFAPHSFFVNWYVGGLNFQIEHHLFPRVSHVHYPAISKIVKQTCQEFDLPYNSFPTMMGSMMSHFRMMKQLGRKPKEMMNIAELA